MPQQCTGNIEAKSNFISLFFICIAVAPKDQSPLELDTIHPHRKTVPAPRSYNLICNLFKIAELK